MTHHVMLDLETMGTAPDAAIVQLGAIRFDPHSDAAPHDGFEANVSLQSALLEGGGSLNQSTLDWWRARPLKNRSTLCGTSALPLYVVLRAFDDWLDDKSDPRYIWSHGAAFDVPILESAYRALHLATPWDYRRVRDTRTLFDLAASLADWERPKTHVAHTALSDATQQARDVQAAYAALRGRSRSDPRTYGAVPSVDIVQALPRGGRYYEEVSNPKIEKGWWNSGDPNPPGVEPDADFRKRIMDHAPWSKDALIAEGPELDKVGRRFGLYRIKL